MEINNCEVKNHEKNDENISKYEQESIYYNGPLVHPWASWQPSQKGKHSEFSNSYNQKRESIHYQFQERKKWYHFRSYRHQILKDDTMNKLMSSNLTTQM